jgi:ARG/rhodanese/phosphatase superfamily protein
LPSQVGVIVCVGGRLSCADVFDTPQLLAALWEALAASYLAEAL